MEIEIICKEIDEMIKRLYFAASSIRIANSIKAVCITGEEDILAPDYFFWHTVLDNCYFRALTELAKIYDETKDSVGLKKIINQVKQSSWKKEEIKNQLVYEAQKKYDSNSESRVRLRLLRDKGLAHMDKAYATNLKELTLNNPMLTEEVEHMISIAFDICNSFLGEFKGVQRTLFAPLDDDASNIIASLKIMRDLKMRGFIP